MKSKFAIAITTAAALFGASQSQASDGTITVNGQLTAATCAVTSGTPAGSGNVTVTLPTLPVTALTAASPIAGTTPFTVSVGGANAGCTSKTSFVTYFEASSNVLSSGRIAPTGGTATGVNFVLLNSNGTVIDASKPSGSQGVTVGTITSGVGTQNYSVGYYSTGVATPGTVSGSINYSIVYP